MPIALNVLQKFDFDWEVLDVIIGGGSAIDSGKRLRVRSPDEANRFLECYGYDVENPIEKAELFGNFQEAMMFVRRYFLQPANPDGLKLEVPRKIQEVTELSQLLMFASGGGESQGASELQALWACALLKIMHTISHIDKDIRTTYFTDIQKQILDRFYRHIHSDENGQVYLGKDARDPDRVNLVSFDSKPKKSRDSVILKLLHKPENVAEELFDRVGIRFVTQNRFDALRVIKYLKDRHVIMPANIKPSRSKNNLIDTEAFSNEIKNVVDKIDHGKISVDALYDHFVKFCNSNAALPEGQRDAENPHSSKHYQSLQFTCRQLIKIRNSLYDELREVKSLIKTKRISGELVESIEKLDLRNIQKEIRFFYPFEVQVYDDVSHQENMAGRSSHTNYKKSQVQAAMKRVMRELIRYCERQNAPS